MYQPDELNKARDVALECIAAFQQLANDNQTATIALSLAMLLSGISDAIHGGKKCQREYLDIVIGLAINMVDAKHSKSHLSNQEIGLT